MTFQLLKCLARAVVTNAGRFLLDVIPGGMAVYDIAVETWENYQSEEHDQSLRQELQALAAAPGNQIREEVQDAVEAEAGDQPEEVQQAVGAYLHQVPAMIRRSLRRASDPSGTTIPDAMAFDEPEDLLPFLPSRPPQFKSGDQPLPGVDRVLDELLGVGGFGEVWRATQPYMKSRAPVALKFCLDEKAAKSLWNETAALEQASCRR